MNAQQADIGSPVRNDGRGLKHVYDAYRVREATGSPVRNDGRGLKHHRSHCLFASTWARPSEMTGVD